MKTNLPTNWFTAMVVFSCWLALAGCGTSADDKVDAKEKIKELQKQRLEAAKKARDYLLRAFQQGFLPPGIDDTGAFIFRLVEVNKLVFQARLDLCEKKSERIKVIEETIKEFEPLVAAQDKKAKAGQANATFNYHLLEVHLLELKIALAKAKQETGAP